MTLSGWILFEDAAERFVLLVVQPLPESGDSASKSTGVVGSLPPNSAIYPHAK